MLKILHGTIDVNNESSQCQMFGSSLHFLRLCKNWCIEIPELSSLVSKPLVIVASLMKMFYIFF